MWIKNLSKPVIKYIKDYIDKNEIYVFLESLTRDHFYDEMYVNSVDAIIDYVEFPNFLFDHYDNDELSDLLSYWNTFYSPPKAYVDEYLGWECGLIPFYYGDEFYLALGGCGMDLSPKLDAYQFLTSNTLPGDTKLFSDPKYFKYVVGTKIYKRILNECANIDTISVEIRGNFKLLNTKSGWTLVRRNK